MTTVPAPIAGVSVLLRGLRRRLLLPALALSALAGSTVGAAPSEYFVSGSLVGADGGGFNTGIGSGNSGNLRYCISQANGNPNPEGSVIYLLGASFTLNAPLPPITKPMTIQSYIDSNLGYGVNTINANFTGRIFFVDSQDGNVYFQDLILANGRAKGGNGAQGGGGGLGAGGAIFVNVGSVTATRVSFQNCAAVGGNGGTGYINGLNTLGGGGGGGLGGNGGSTVLGGEGGAGGGGFGGNGGNTGGGNDGSGGGGLAGNGGNGSSSSYGGGGGGIGNGGNANGSTGGAGGAGGGGNGSTSTGDATGGGPNGGGGGGGTRTPFTNSAAGDGGRFGGGGGGSEVNSGGHAGLGGEFGGGGGMRVATKSAAPGGWGGGGGAGPGQPDQGGNQGAAGAGGFGGGGGGAIQTAVPGGTYGGANGYTDATFRIMGGGGGGGALGGAVFVRAYPTTGSVYAYFGAYDCSFSGSSVTAGPGGQTFSTASGRPASPGIAAGRAIYFGSSLDLGGSSNQTVSEDLYGEPAQAPNALNFIGSGSVTLSGNNTYTGTTGIYGGKLVVGSATALGTPGNKLFLTQNGGPNVPLLDLNGFDVSAGSFILSANASVRNDKPATTATLTVNPTINQGNVNGTLVDGSGKLALTKIGAGTLTLSSANTYTGGTVVSGGMLQFIGNGSVYNNGALAGSSLAVSGGAVLSFARNDTFGNAVVSPLTAVTLDNARAENSGNFFNTLGNLTLNNGSELRANGGANAGYQAFQLRGTVSVGGTTPSSITAPSGTNNAVQLDGIAGATVFSVADVTNSPNPDLTVSAILGNGYNGANVQVATGLTKTGSGTLRLTAANTYTGGTTINAGTVSAGFTGFNGTFAGGSTVTINAGGTLLCEGVDALGYFAGNANLVVNGGTVTTDAVAGSRSTLQNTIITGGTFSSPAAGGGFLLNGTLATKASPLLASITSPIFYLYGPTTVFNVERQPGSVVDLQIDSSIQFFTGAPNAILTKTGAGILRLNGANTYPHGTSLSGGVLAVGHPTALGTGPLSFVGGTLRLEGINTDFSPRFAAVTSGNFIRLDTNGQAVAFGTVLSGAGGLVKTGAGNLTLSTAQNYSGPTTLSAGTLILTSGASLAATSATTVSSGATLQNSGNVQGLVTLSGTLAGNGTLSGGLTVNSGVLVNYGGSGNLTLKGAITNNGVMRFSGGAVLNAGTATSFINNGVLDVITAGAGTTLPTITGTGIVLTASVVKVKTAARAGAVVTITIDSFDGHTYSLQRSTGLASDTFQPVQIVGGGNLPSQAGVTGTTLTFTDPAAPAGEVFYRVMLNP